MADDDGNDPTSNFIPMSQRRNITGERKNGTILYQQGKRKRKTRRWSNTQNAPKSPPMGTIYEYDHNDDAESECSEEHHHDHDRHYAPSKPITVLVVTWCQRRFCRHGQEDEESSIKPHPYKNIAAIWSLVCTILLFAFFDISSSWMMTSTTDTTTTTTTTAAAAEASFGAHTTNQKQRPVELVFDGFQPSITSADQNLIFRNTQQNQEYSPRGYTPLHKQEQLQQHSVFESPRLFLRDAPTEINFMIDTEWDNYHPLMWNAMAHEHNTHDDSVPVLWRVPRSGGSRVEQILLDCHHKVVASDIGVQDGHGKDKQLKSVHISGQDKNALHVNVDLSTTSGLERAMELRLIPSGKTDVVVTPLLWEATQLFRGAMTSQTTSLRRTPQKIRGRVFCVFRHPIERAVSMFLYTRTADWEPYHRPEFKKWTLKDYASSDLVQDNYMTRQLARNSDMVASQEEPLTMGHLAAAKAVLCQKILVGLSDRLEESMARFETFFGWRRLTRNTETCRTSHVSGRSGPQFRHHDDDDHYRTQRYLPHETSVEYEILRQKNEYDLLLYDFVRQLFDFQSHYTENISNR